MPGTPVELTKAELKAVRPTTVLVKLPTDMPEELRYAIRELITHIEDLQTTVARHEALLAKCQTI